jgi:hypothetical protein
VFTFLPIDIVTYVTTLKVKHTETADTARLLHGTGIPINIAIFGRSMTMSELIEKIEQATDAGARFSGLNSI